MVENLSEAQYVASIRDEGKIYTACGDGKVPFVSAKDIAVTAYHGLVDPKPLPSDLRVLGPELLTYDEVSTCHKDFETKSWSLLLIVGFAGCGDDE